MIKTATRESKTGADILRLQIRQFLQHLLWSEAIGEQIHYVLDSNTQATYARTSAALLWINRNAFGQVWHVPSLLVPSVPLGTKAV